MSEPHKRKSWPIALALFLAGALTLALLATSSQPWVSERPAATAEQVEAARVLFREARKSRKTGRASQLTLDAAELDSVAVLISQGFAPYRMDAALAGNRLQLTLSRPLFFRWINTRAELAGRSEGFPPVRLRVGAIALPPWLAHLAIEGARQLLILRGAQLPPLDALVQSTEIGSDTAKVAIVLPRTGLIDQAAGDENLDVDDAAVAEIYCALVQQQQAIPEFLFARQLSRALAFAGRSETPGPGRNGAALIALAMLTVSPDVGELAGDVASRVAKCPAPSVALTLQGRADLAKHWSLSAALTVATGGQLATAMGEWKELADSLSSSRFLAPNDRSGFSFVDLAADRAGFLTALALMDPDEAEQASARLAPGSEGAILPGEALALEDGLSNDVFIGRYGATDDPRFDAKVQRIDAMLAGAGIGSRNQ